MNNVFDDDCSKCKCKICGESDCRESSCGSCTVGFVSAVVSCVVTEEK